MKRPKPPCSDHKGRELNRRQFLKIPALTTGVLFGSIFLPPWVKVLFSATHGVDLELRGHVCAGMGRFTLPLPAFIIRKILRSGIKKSIERVKTFSPLKREIHHWVVKELPKRRSPLKVQDIASHFGQDINVVAGIVNELEAEKTFLYRNNSDGINWAYPVTLEQTPHHLKFSSGETVYAA